MARSPDSLARRLSERLCRPRLSSLDAVASAGCVVSLPHKAAMQSSFPLLKKNYKFSNLLFFGKILGKAGDYLVAVGIEESFEGPKKYFYWCARPPA